MVVDRVSGFANIPTFYVSLLSYHQLDLWLALLLDSVALCNMSYHKIKVTFES